MVTLTSSSPAWIGVATDSAAASTSANAGPPGAENDSVMVVGVPRPTPASRASCSALPLASFQAAWRAARTSGSVFEAEADTLDYDFVAAPAAGSIDDLTGPANVADLDPDIV